ncbi:MAG TPA: M23 family metallopeptidase [Longimicrobiaceae bacterium]|nr:M23 family metallopeptidase [Longimicrobiaceae bacterium]
MRYLSGKVRWRTLFLAAAWLEGAVLAGLLVYLAVTGRVLVVSLERREALKAAGEERGLAIPVAGVRRQELRDSFHAPRSGGRQHLGIDIMAPEGTPVLAAAGGVIVKRDSSALGGISLYERGHDGATIYFYAHLSRYAAGIDEGDLVRQGDVIAYVGHTGNADASAPHLHFGVYTVTDPNRWWHGRDLDPYLLLTSPSGSESAR